MKQFYFILYLVSSAVWGQVDCELPMTSNVSHNFDITNNGITGIYNALQTITASNEINNTTYLAPEIILGDNFKATSNTEVLLSIENCSICNCVDNLGVSFGVSGGGAPGSIPSYWYTIDYNHAICENEGITYSWDFGNGVTYTGTTVIHPWTSMYQNVTVYATSPNGCTSTIVKKKLYTPPPASTPPPPTEVVIVVDKDETITIDAEEIVGQGIYNWYDSEGNLVFQGKDLFIASTVAEKYHLEVISSIDGFTNYSEVDIVLKPNRLETLFPNPSTGGNLNITYKINEAQSAYIMIFSYYMTGGISYNYIVDKDATEKNIDVSSYPFGLYKVALVTDGQIVDVKILSKQ